LSELERIKQRSQKKAYYFKAPKAALIEFQVVEDDVKMIEKLGKIGNVNHCQTPLTIFNTESFSVFEYREKQQQFMPLQINDEENLAERIPKNYRSVYLQAATGGDEFGSSGEGFLIAGGLDGRTGQSSKKSFIFERGAIREIMPMYHGR
jgi:hypothetical protein